MQGQDVERLTVAGMILALFSNSDELCLVGRGYV